MKKQTALYLRVSTLEQDGQRQAQGGELPDTSPKGERATGAAGRRRKP